jgi:hypothetical protein
MPLPLLGALEGSPGDPLPHPFGLDGVHRRQHPGDRSSICGCEVDVTGDDREDLQPGLADEGD